jgi:hypothetical protein
MTGRGTKLFLATLAAVCIAAAFLSPLFTSRAPLSHGKSSGDPAYLIAGSPVLLLAGGAMAQLRRAEAQMTRGDGIDLQALTCTRLC